MPRCFSDIPTLSFIDYLKFFQLPLPERLKVITKQHPDIVRLSSRSQLLLIQEANAIAHVLRDNSQAYDKNFNLYHRTKFFLGEGLLVQNGETWRSRRKLLQPHFTHHAMPQVFDITYQKSQTMVARWQSYAKKNTIIDLGQEIALTMMQIATEALCHYSLNEQEARELASDYMLTQRYAHRAMSLHPYFPSLTGWRARRSHRRIAAWIEKISKQHTLHHPPDFLDSLQNAIRCPERHFNAADLQAEMRTFLGGGHETVTSGLLWTIISLLQHPDHVKTLEDELEQVLGKKNMTHEDLDALSWTKMVFQEGLRLFPPVWITGRHLLEEDQLCGYSISPETLVIICFFTLHRDPRHWPHPDTFDPYRFSAEATALRHKYAYLPFGAGSRGCIAQLFAMIQGPVVLAMLMKHFKIELLSKDFTYETYFTMRPKYPVYVRVKEKGLSR